MKRYDLIRIGNELVLFRTEDTGFGLTLTLADKSEPGDLVVEWKTSVYDACSWLRCSLRGDGGRALDIDIFGSEGDYQFHALDHSIVFTSSAKDVLTASLEIQQEIIDLLTR